MPGTFTAKIMSGVMIGAMSIAAPATIALAFAPAASAQSTLPIIDPAITSAVLNIHKYESDPLTGAAYTEDGTVVDMGTTKPMSGVKFTIQKINNLDVRKVDDWVAYSKLDPNNIAANTLGTAETVTTDAAGLAQVTKDLGFYYVKEVADPTGKRTSIAPFLVALPLTNPDSAQRTWNYDVHVYPKNQLISVTKSLTDKGVVVGSKINYKVSGAVPSVEGNTVEGQSFNRYILTDDYSEDAVTPDTASAKVQLVDSKGVELASNKLVAADYTITDSNPAGKLTVTLTPSGLTKLTAARKATTDVKVQLSFDATIKTVPSDGVIENKAGLLPPQSPGSTASTTEIPSNTVLTKMVQLKVVKVANDAAKTPLENAEFELHRCATGTSNIIANDPAVSINGTTKFKTQKDGTVTINGVQVTDFWNNAKQTPAYDFCLLETQAPAGYELNPKAIPVTLNEAAMTNAVTANKIALVSQEVTNVPSNGGFKLPITGEQGAMWIILGSVVVGGTVMLLMARRKES